MTLAPIAIFAFNRPDSLERLLHSLKRNPEFNQSQTFIFIDGARNTYEQSLVSDVERIAKGLQTSGGVEVIRRSLNLGLASSILTGIDQIFERYETVIVLEDDLVISENFLKFCNQGLIKYSSNSGVASIQGFTHGISLHKQDTFFMLGADCWGWATWKNRWQELERDGAKLLANLRESRRESEFDLKGAYPYTRMLERQALGLVDSWAIRWHASMFLKNKVSLYPSRSLVENYGQDGSGTHYGSRNFVPRKLSSFIPRLECIPVAENVIVNRKIRKVLREKYGTYSPFHPMKYVTYLRRKLKEIINSRNL